MATSRLLPLALLASMVGCSAAAGSSEAQTSADTQERTGAGTPLVDCWLETDDINRVDMVACGIHTDALALPVRITGLNVSDDHGFGSDVPLDATASQRVTQYDPTRQLIASITWDASGVAGLAALDQLKIPVVMDGNARGRAKAKTGNLPFEIWRIAIVGHAPMTGATLDDTTLAITDQYNQATQFPVHATLDDVAAGATKAVFVAAAPKSTLTGTASFGGTSAAFALKGPGTYFVEATGLTRAAEDAGAPAAWSCWVQGTDQLQLACRPEAAEGLSLQLAKVVVTPASGPQKTELVIYEADSKAYSLVDEHGRTPVPDSGAIIVADLDASAFPLKVDLDVGLTGNPTAVRSYQAGEILGLGTSSDPDPFTKTTLQGTFTAQGPTDVTRDVPYTVHMPFRLWPVTFSTTTEFFGFKLDDYTVTAAAPWGASAIGDKIAVGGVTLPPLRADVTPTTYYLAVDASITSLSGTANFHDSDPKPITIGGPGAYVAQPDGLHAVAN
jgi:hypothetical protein